MGESAGTEPKLNWSTAQVHDGELTIEVAGDVPKQWRRSFEATTHLLDRGEWGEVKVKKGTVRVHGISPGDEERLRHFLESAVQQANADVGRNEATSEEDEPEAEPADAQGDGEPEPDAEMTERFRSFADAGPDSEPAAG